MARRRQRTKLTVSLFPFLSILACVIGTLTLLITALALGQMDNDTVASAEKYENVKKKSEFVRQRLQALREKLSRAESTADDTRKKLADARAEFDRLQREKEEVFRQIENKDPKKPEDVEIPEVDTAKHKQRMEDIRAEIHRQQEEIEELLAELKRRNKPPEEARVVIQPGGSGVDLDPTFVECTASDVVLYEGRQPQRIRRSDLSTDKTFLGLLDRIAKRPKATVIFLVRDDALGTYFTARDIARSRYARNGKLPVLGHGKIDLSLFGK